jgi:hypothetical protein
MRRLLLLPALLLIASCNTNEDPTPTAPSPGNTIPTIGGTYSSPGMWRLELNLPDEQTVFMCAGSLTIGNQVGDNFSGSFLILDPNCGSPFRGDVVNGVYRSDGTVTFELTFSDASTNFITGAFGCAYVSGATAITGTLIDTRLEGEARTELDCGADGRASQLIRLGGNR